MGPSMVIVIEKCWCNATLNYCVVIVRNNGSAVVSIVRACVVGPSSQVYVVTYSSPVRVVLGNISRVVIKT